MDDELRSVRLNGSVELGRADKLLIDAGKTTRVGRDAVSAGVKKTWSGNARLIISWINMLVKTLCHNMSVATSLSVVVACTACFLTQLGRKYG